MSNEDISPRSLTKEKRLWDIYILSRRIKATPFNFLSTTAVFAALSIQCITTRQSLAETLEIVRKFSETGLQVSITVLGFLIAGFTIFSTVSQPALLIRMSETRHQETGLSWLKYNFFIFMRVFFYYIFYSATCSIFIMFGQKNGLASTLVRSSPHAKELEFLLINFAYIFIFTGLFFLIMQLKSFTFNVYHSVMTSIRWQAEQQAEDE